MAITTACLGAFGRAGIERGVVQSNMEAQLQEGLHLLLDRLIDQLDTLISSLALSRKDAFQMLNEHRLAQFADNKDALPAAYPTYRRHHEDCA